MCRMGTVKGLVMLGLWGTVALVSCSSVKSVVPGLKSENELEPGDKLHLKVSPEEAIQILDEVAAQHDWQIYSVGDQFDLQGYRGKYFRLETSRFIGGRDAFSGVFFTEPSGSYVIVGKNETGLPPELLEPFLAAVEAHTGQQQEATPEEKSQEQSSSE